MLIVLQLVTANRFATAFVNCFNFVDMTCTRRAFESYRSKLLSFGRKCFKTFFSHFGRIFRVEFCFQKKRLSVKRPIEKPQNAFSQTIQMFVLL